MTNQDTLLSDEVIDDQLEHALGELCGIALNEGILRHRDGKKTDRISQMKDKKKALIKDLINTQKRLYAASVIGEDEKQIEPDLVMDIEDNINYERIAWWNKLRAEQRKRIK